MRSRKRELTYGPPLLYTLLGTISAGRIGRSAAPPLWKQGSLTMCGQLRNYSIRRTNKWKLIGTRISRERVLS
jgi:hypothetical protein